MKPKKPYTEGTLLQDMSSISKYGTDPEIKKETVSSFV